MFNLRTIKRNQPLPEENSPNLLFKHIKQTTSTNGVVDIRTKDLYLSH